ncbi:MAG: DUF692 domain-containing protein [Gammaproteobacteria bacterium]|nr:DUF692 domain-containing protein [Gammaproteobacteria bacterium]MCW5583048.1 DUF692 domain-containing protein [Gammaproteobacteria bacterium]
MNPSLLLTGIGLRPPHYSDFLEKRPGVAWLEVHSENYFADGGKPLHILEKIRHDYPVSLHGVGLSLGSADELNWNHLKKLRDLITHINPCLISDHLCWSSVNGQYLHDLLPLPYSEETLQHVVSRIQQIQDYLNRQILIENISSYINFKYATISEQDFLREVAEKSGCGILLDINNIYVNSINLGFDPKKYILTIPSNLVQEIHLAGFTTATINEKEVLIDSHSQPVMPIVWELYRYATQQLGRKPTIIEWDSNIPSLETLYLEAARAESIMRETYVPTKLTS